MTHRNVIDRLHELVTRHGTQAKAAASLGITAVYFGDLLRGRRDPGPRVLAAIGLRKTTRASYTEARREP